MSTYIYKKVVLKGIAVSLVAALCLEMPASAAGVFSASPTAAARPSGVPIVFPASVAVIEDRFEAAGDRRIILIQDAHTNESAQINSARVIEKIIAERPVRTVFLEAGTGDDSLTRLREAASGTDRARVALRFVRKGLLQGAEYVNLVSDLDLTLWGVEDPDLYAQALDSYRAVTASRDAATGYLDRIDVTLAYLKEKTFSPVLLELDSARRSFAAGEISAAAYLSVLEKTARVSGVDPGAVNGFDRVSRLMRRERSIRQDRVADEMHRAVAGLSDAARAELEKAFEAGEGLAHPSGPAAWARAFRSAAGREHRSILREHPNLSAYLRTAQVMAALDGLGVLRSMTELETLLYARLARPRAMELARAGFAAEALRNLVLMKLAPEDMRRLRASGGRVWDVTALTGFVNRRLMDLGQGVEKTVFLRTELEPVFAAALEFYRLTLLRDEAFVRNLETRMSATGEREAALVAGGYHAPHLKKLFRERGISFVSVIPQTAHPTDHDRYERLLLAQSSVRPEEQDGFAGSAASAMSLRPAAEDGTRLALLAAELGAPALPARTVPIPASARTTPAATVPSAARMSAEAAIRPVFLNALPEIGSSAPAEAVFSTEFEMPAGHKPEGQFFLRRGIPGGRWDFLPVQPEAVPGSDDRRWKLSVPVTPYVEGTRRYEGTFVWFVPGIRPRKRQGADPDAVWQAPGPGANRGIDLTLTSEEASRHWQAAASSVREHLSQSTETPLQKILPHHTIPAVRGAVRQAVELLAAEPRDIQVRLRIYQFLRDAYNLNENYLGLPAAWFMDSTGLEIIQQYPPAEEIQSSEAVSTLFWKQIINLLRDDLKRQLHTHFSSRMGVPHLRRHEEVTHATADARIDLLHGGVAKDLPVFGGSGQAVVNAAVRLKDHEGNEVPGFSIRVRMPQAHNPQRPAIRFAGRYYDILSKDPETPEGYAVIRKYEHVYDASFSPEAAEDLHAKYAIGALKLLMELIGKSGLEEFLKENGRDIDIEVDSFLPERTGMGGSVTLGALVTSALLEHMLLLEKFSHEDVALLGMYLEASLGDLGGWQDGYIGPALRFLRIEKDQPVVTLKNLVPSDKKGGKAQRELLRQLETHGVLFLTHPHRSSHTLRQLIGGYLRRDEPFMGAAAEGEKDLERFREAFQTAMDFDSGVSIEQIAGWLNRATGQFETAAPGFVTPDMKEMVDELSRRGWIRAAKPVGAGAGGFIFLLLTSPARRTQVEQYLAEWAEKNRDRIREQVDENFLPPHVYQISFNPDAVTGREIRHSDYVGARMAAEVELGGDSPASGAAWGTAAIYEPETAEGILFRIPSEDIEVYAADFTRLTDGVQQAIPTMNGASEKDTAALAEYFAEISGRILTEFTESRGRGERAVNPIARLIRQIKDDLEEGEGAESPDVLALRQLLVDEVRAQSLHLAHLTDSDDPQARLDAAGDEAVRGKRILQGSVARYGQIIQAIDQNIKRLDHLIKIKTDQLERKNKLAAEIRAGRAVSALGSDARRYHSAKAAAKEVQQLIDRSVIHRGSLVKRRDIVEAFKMAVEGNLLDKYFPAADPDGLAVRERMIRENRRFDAIMYDDMLVKGLFKQRRKFRTQMQTKPERAPFYEKANELILEVTQVMARIAKDRGSDASAFQLQAAGNEGQLVLFVHDVLSEDILREIWNQHGHRIRSVVTTSATMVSHWVIVARGLPNPPAIILIKDQDAIKAARRVRSGQTVAVAAQSGTGASRVYVNPAPERRAQVDRTALEAERVHRHAVRSMGEASPLPILANVTPQEHSGLAERGADGVGLVRTEVWDQEELEAMSAIVTAWGAPGTAEAQLQRIGLHWFFLYRRLLKEAALHNNKATFRTLDIQWDKNQQFLELLQKEVRERPQDFPGVDPEKLTGFDFYRTPLGTEVLARQIAAMGLARFDLRGTSQRPALRIMFPDIKSQEDLEHLTKHVLPRAEELFHWTAHKEAAKWSLLPKALQPYDEKRRIVGEFGLMIETAEALETLEAFAQHPLSGFWSVGTNDLTASMESLSLKRKAERSGVTAADQDHRVSRDEPQYEKLFTSLTPKLLIAADRIVAAAAAAAGRKLEVGFCGEIAGTDKFLLYLLYLRHHGVPLYASMAAPQIAQAKLLTRLADEKASKKIDLIFKEIKPGDDGRARRLAAELIADEMKSAAPGVSGARMSGGFGLDDIDWSMMAPDMTRSFVRNEFEATIERIRASDLSTIGTPYWSLETEIATVRQLSTFWSLSGRAYEAVRVRPEAPHQRAAADIMVFREQVMKAWTGYEAAKVEAMKDEIRPGQWPRGQRAVYEDASHIQDKLRDIGARIRDLVRDYPATVAAQAHFEAVVVSPVAGALARVMISMPAAQSDEVRKPLHSALAFLQSIENPARILDSVLKMPGLKKEDFDRVNGLRTALVEVGEEIRAYGRFRGQEIQVLLPPAALMVKSPEQQVEEAAEEAGRLDELSERHRAVAGVLRPFVTKNEEVSDEQLFFVLDAFDNLDQTVMELVGGVWDSSIYHLIGLMSDQPSDLSSFERRIMREWAQRHEILASEDPEERLRFERLRKVIDAMGDAMLLIGDAESESLGAPLHSLHAELSYHVLRPLVKVHLIRAAGPSHTKYDAITKVWPQLHEASASRIDTVLFQVRNRNAQAEAGDFRYQLAEEFLVSAQALIRSAGGNDAAAAASAARLSEVRQLREWAARPAAASYLGRVASLPASSGRNFALWTGDQDRVLSVRPSGSGRVRVYEATVLGGRGRIRPVITLPSRPAAARMSARNVSTFTADAVIPDWVGPLQAFMKANHLTIVPAVNDAKEPDAGLIRPALGLTADRERQAIAAIHVLNVRQLSLRPDQLVKGTAGETLRAWLEFQDAAEDLTETAGQFDRRVPLVPSEFGNYLPQSDEFRIAARVYPHFVPRRPAVSIEPSMASTLAAALTAARRDADGLNADADRTRRHLASLDLSIFKNLDNETFVSMAPMIAAAAERARKRAGGEALVRIIGPDALRGIFFAAVADSPARPMLIDEEDILPQGYKDIQPARIGTPASLRDATRPMPVQPIGPAIGGKISLPAVELWFDAAFYLSGPDASAEKLFEFFKKRTGRSDFTLEDVRGLMSGKFNLSLLHRLALPPLLRVPLGELVRAAATAARMSERSA